MVQRTVASVDERFNLSRVTNCPELGIVSKKTQDSLTLLREGKNRLIENFNFINPLFIDQIEPLALTTQVEKLHAVSHETFSTLNYAQDFGTIVKESLKRITTWAAKYFTRDKSYYPVPDTSMPLSAVSTMALPAVQTMAKEDEDLMKDWMENFDRQRTVRSETTKDKAGSTLSSRKQNIPMCSLIRSQRRLTTHQHLVLSLKPLSSQIITLASMSCKHSVELS